MRRLTRDSPNKSTPRNDDSKKGEHPFHRQRLPDDAACVFGELGPVGAELKFERNARDDPERETQRKDAGPESRDLVIMVPLTEQVTRAQIHQQQGESHRELRKEVVKRGRDGELQPVILQRGIHHYLTPLNWPATL